MSILRSAFERRSRTIDDAIADGTYGRPGFGSWSQGMVWQPSSSTAGVDGAAQLTAVFAAWRLLSDAIGTLPLDVFRRGDADRVPVEPPSYLRFTGDLSRIDYLTQVVLSLLIDGNAFVAVVRDGLGKPTSLTPLDPAAVEVVSTDRATPYHVGDLAFSPWEIMHITGMVQPGAMRGMSPLMYAREVVDGARQAQRYGSQLFANSAVPPAVIEVPDSPGGPSEADAAKAKRVAETWNETHQGADRAGKIGVLIGGATLRSIAIPPEDAQWLETRKFGVQEVARIYGVPPHLLADSSNSTSWGSGLAEQNLAFAQFSLLPWTTRIEHAHDRLMASDGSGDLFVRLNLDARLRASLPVRYNSYRVGITAGFLTPNEARQFEDLPPKDGGDELGASVLIQPEPKEQDDGSIS